MFTSQDNKSLVGENVLNAAWLGNVNEKRLLRIYSLSTTVHQDYTICSHTSYQSVGCFRAQDVGMCQLTNSEEHGHRLQTYYISVLIRDLKAQEVYSNILQHEWRSHILKLLIASMKNFRVNSRLQGQKMQHLGPIFVSIDFPHDNYSPFTWCFWPPLGDNLKKLSRRMLRWSHGGLWGRCGLFWTMFALYILCTGHISMADHPFCAQ